MIPAIISSAGGRQAFEAAIGFRPPLNTLPGRLSGAFGIGGYVGAGVAVAAVLLAIPLFILHTNGARPGVAGPARRPGCDPRDRRRGGAGEPRPDARASARRCCPLWNFVSGVPAHLRTVVAVPTLLTTVAAIEEQIERLEVHHLASPEGDLHFALLSDWLDAATEHVDGDAALLETAVAGIARLNRRYGPAPGGDRFLLLHRKRVWNAARRGGSAGNASAASCMS